MCKLKCFQIGSHAVHSYSDPILKVSTEGSRRFSCWVICRLFLKVEHGRAQVIPFLHLTETEKLGHNWVTGRFRNAVNASTFVHAEGDEMQNVIDADVRRVKCRFYPSIFCI